MEFLLVFLVMLVNDFVWSIYIKALAVNRMLKASFFSSLAVLLEAFAVITYVGNYWTLIPAVVGAFLGTYLTKFIEKRR